MSRYFKSEIGFNEKFTVPSSELTRFQRGQVWFRTKKPMKISCPYLFCFYTFRRLFSFYFFGLKSLFKISTVLTNAHVKVAMFWDQTGIAATISKSVQLKTVGAIIHVMKSWDHFTVHVVTGTNSPQTTRGVLT